MADEADILPNVADFSHAWMRRVEQKVDRTDAKVDLALEMLLRHETRMGRIERDVGEVKLDIGGLDTRPAALTTETMRTADTMDLKLEALNASVGKLMRRWIASMAGLQTSKESSIYPQPSNRIEER